MFHPTMSYENDSSDYRQLENFENSSINKSDKNGIPEIAAPGSLEQSTPQNLSAGNLPQSESDQIMKTYANELENKKLQSFALDAEQNKPRDTNSIQMPTTSSAEIMRKSLDKAFGSSFQPTP